MPTISNLGIGANLDLNKQIEQMEIAEHQRLQPLIEQKKSYDAQISAFGKIQSSLEKLKEATKELRKYEDINTTKVNGEYDSFSLKTTSKAVAGIYEISVTQLAKTQTMTTKSFSNPKELLGNNNNDCIIKITQPAEKEPTIISLDKSHTSLIDIADAINKIDKPINAAIIKNKNNQHFLVLTSSKEGIDYRINISVEGDDSLAEILNVDSILNNRGDIELKSNNIEQKIAPKNALLKINGIEFESQSNTTKELFPGFDLTLKKESKKNTPENLIITNDSVHLKEKIQTWVNSYNDFQKLSKELTKFIPKDKYNDKSQNNGPLIGNSVLRNIQNKLYSILITPQDNCNINTLSKMGIKQNLDNTLDINHKKLDSTLKENRLDIKEFLIGNGKKTGFVTNNFNFLTAILNENEGVLHSTKNGFHKKNKNIDKSIVQMNKQINNNMDMYRRKFQNLDKLMNTLNNTSNSLIKLIG